MDDENQVSQEDFLKAFGVSTPGEGETTPPAGDTNTDGDTSNATDGNQNSANPGTDGQDPAADTTDGEGASQNGDNNGNQNGANKNEGNDTTSKSAQAFAAMRVELAQKNRMLEGVASVLGIDLKSKDSMDQLQIKLNEALAKKQGVSPEIMDKLNKFEQMEEQRNIEQVRNNAFMGFQKVKTQFGLDDAKLQEFANQLVAEGKNPFTTPLDLVTEYKLKNFETLLEQAKAQGAQEEIARATKANNNASTPGTNQGAQDNSNDVQQISTVKQLNEWFNKQQ